MTSAAKLIDRASQVAERIAATKEGREAARLSAGNPALEAITHRLFGRDV